MKKDAKIILYTTFYNESNSLRRSELLQSIENNLGNSEIDSVIVLNEADDLSYLSTKIINVSIDKRPTYLDFISIINERNQKTLEISIICNTDIFFDKNIAVLKHLNLDNTCFALGRWDTTEGERPELYNHNDSQDVWIFKGKVKEGLKSNFPLGVPRCDNRFMFDLEISGYEVKNPSFSIKAYHLHKGQVHVVYSEDDNVYKIEGPYRYLYPHNQFNLIKTLLFNLQHPYKVGNYRYDLKKLNGWWVFKIWRRIYKLINGKDMPLIGYDIS